MEEPHGFAAMIKKLDITRRPVTHLIEAIGEGDIQKCETLIANMDKRQINKLKHPKNYHYRNCVVTPLLWAVMNHQNEIAELLLSKGAAPDRLGYFEAERVVNKLSPLLRAIDHRNERMIELLLKYDVDIYKPIPGPRLMEEEGGSVRYCRYNYPVDYCFGKSMNIFERLLDRGDMYREYGIAQHTIFCSTVNNFLKADHSLFKSDNLQYIYLALQYGGMICTGRQREGLYVRLGYCSAVYDLVQLLSHMVKQETMNTAIVRLINCLYLVFSSGYVCWYSPIYSLVKCLPHVISLEDISKLKCEHSFERISLDRLNWMLELSQKPSSLQIICRSAIRRHMKSCKPSECRKLPLPTHLISFVSFESSLDGIPYLLLFDTDDAMQEESS